MSNNNNNPEPIKEETNETGKEKPLSKKAQKKKEQEEKKEKEKKEREAKEKQTRLELLEKYKDIFGYREMAEIITDKNPLREYFNLKNLDSSMIGKDIWLRGRVYGKKS